MIEKHNGIYDNGVSLLQRSETSTLDNSLCPLKDNMLLPSAADQPFL